MRILIKNAELVSGSDLFLSSEKNSAIEFFWVPEKEKCYRGCLEGSYYIHQNFAKRTGPIVLNQTFEEILNLADGRRNLGEIAKKLNELNVYSGESLDFGNALSLLMKKLVSFKDLYGVLFKGVSWFGKRDIKKAFFILESAGLIKFSERKTEKSQNYGGFYGIESWLHLTGNCNLACDYCYVDKKNLEMSRETGFEIVDKLFSSARRRNARYVQLKFSGGEPLIKFPLLLEISDYALRKGEETGIKTRLAVLTNGTLIDEEKIKEIKKRKISVTVSLDGIRHWHDRHAKYAGGKGSFFDVERGIDLLLANGIRPWIITVVNADNLEGIPEIVKYMSVKKLSAQFNFLKNSPGVPQHFFPDNERLSGVMLKVLGYLKKNLPSDYRTVSAYCNRALGFGCGVVKNYFVFEPNGDLVPCVMSLGNAEHVIGNIKDVDDLFYLIESPGLKKWNPSVSKKKKCLDCPYVWACRGGCSADAFYTTGDFSSPSRYCEVYKKIIPEAMKLVGEILLARYR